MAKQDEKLQAYEELTTQMNASTVALDAEKRQKLHEILHQKPEFAQLLEKFKALCSDNETRKAISEICPASEADDHFDFKAMLQSMGAYCKIDPDKDGYVFNWPGKQTAIQLANEPTENTLIPDKADSRDWDTTQNIYIEGDNLEALKCLRNAYAGKVKMIYIDPPYNTGNDFIYNDNFHGEKVSSDDAGKHTKWLNMMYPRLILARELLSDDGVIFISIDYNENYNLRQILNKVIGDNFFIGEIYWESKTKSQNTETSYDKLQPKAEMILVYSKQAKLRFNLISIGNKEYPESDEKGIYREHILEVMNANGIRGRETMVFDITDGVSIVSLPKGKQWKLGQDQVAIYRNRGDLFIRNNKVILKMRPSDERNNKTEPFWGFFTKEYGTAENAKKELNNLIQNHGIETVKPVEIIKRILFHGSSKSSIILDFFSGSATTAHATMKLNAEDGGNRKYIMVQLPEPTKTDGEAYKAGYKNICEIGKERIRRAGDRIKADNPLTTKDLDIGFRVFRVGKSNIPKWWAVDDAQRQLNMFDNEEDKRTDEEKYRAIAYEFMLKHKCMLDARVDEYLTSEQMAKTGGKPLFVVDGALFICPVGGVNAAWAASVVALRRSRYAMTSNDAWFVAVNDTLGDSSDNRDSDKLLAVKTLVEAGLPAKHFLHI